MVGASAFALLVMASAANSRGNLRAARSLADESRSFAETMAAAAAMARLANCTLPPNPTPETFSDNKVVTEVCGCPALKELAEMGFDETFVAAMKANAPAGTDTSGLDRMPLLIKMMGPVLQTCHKDSSVSGSCLRCGPGTVQVGHQCFGAHATCEGLDYPQSFEPKNSCQCNSRCMEYGNCCKDYEKRDPTCEALGYPSSYVPKNPCQCNEQCMEFDNCCHDKNIQLKPTCDALGNPDVYVPHNPCQCNSRCEEFDNCCSVNRGSICREGVREGATYWDQDKEQDVKCSDLEFACTLSDCHTTFGGKHMLHMWTASIGCCHGDDGDDQSLEDVIFQAKNPNADWGLVFNSCPMWGNFATTSCPLGPDSCSRDPTQEEMSRICSEIMSNGDEEDMSDDSCMSHIGHQGVGGYILPYCNLEGCSELLESPHVTNSTCWTDNGDEEPTMNENTCTLNCKEEIGSVMNECKYFDSITSVARGWAATCDLTAEDEGCARGLAWCTTKDGSEGGNCCSEYDCPLEEVRLLADPYQIAYNRPVCHGGGADDTPAPTPEPSKSSYNFGGYSSCSDGFCCSGSHEDFDCNVIEGCVWEPAYPDADGHLGTCVFMSSGVGGGGSSYISYASSYQGI